MVRYDKGRVDEVGPDIACAEWLLRCGAQVRWKESDKWHKDYNTLPRDPLRNKIEEIDATDSAVMNIGFLHLSKFLFECNIISILNTIPYPEILINSFS